MNRRDFLRITSTALTRAAVPVPTGASSGPQLAVTMDDFNVLDAVRLPAGERSARILDALKRYDARAMALVIGRFAAAPEGDAVLAAWADAGHVIGNHTYSHLDYHAHSISSKEFAEDFTRADAVLRTRKGFTRFFRFPMLHGGDTAEKREAMREVLERCRYREAHVTIDTADWLIDRELRARLVADPDADTQPYRDLYVRHMRAVARYYREAAGEVFGRDIPHTLLTHFNLLSAFHLGDMLDALRSDGWSVIAATDAYRDAVFRRSPNVLPAGDSLVWACARAAGRKLPRPPIEDERWLSAQLDRLKA
jgi:peptidoglycan/xylan/chitin deacetylase (PgdA/CDA1 family)